MSLVMVRLGRPRTAGRCLGAAGHGRAGGRGGAGLAVPRLFFVVLLSAVQVRLVQNPTSFSLFLFEASGPGDGQRVAETPLLCLRVRQGLILLEVRIIPAFAFLAPELQERHR